MVLTRVDGESVVDRDYDGVMALLTRRPLRLTFADSLHKIANHATNRDLWAAAAFARNIKSVQAAQVGGASLQVRRHATRLRSPERRAVGSARCSPAAATGLAGGAAAAHPR